MVDNDSLQEFMEADTTSTEKLIFMAVIALGVKFKTGEIVKPSGELATAADIIKTAGVNRGNGMRALASLISLGVLHKERSGKEFIYYANPFIFSRGKEVDSRQLDRFYKTKWAKKPLEKVVEYG
jgi:hypothetical protein